MRLSNLNIFAACFGLLFTFTSGMVVILISTALPAVAQRLALPLAATVLALPLLVVWWRSGLVPAAVSPQRGSRYRVGHWLVAGTNIASLLAWSLPYLAVAMSGNQNLGLLAWFALPVFTIGFLVWAVGLYMVWSSGA